MVYRYYKNIFKASDNIKTFYKNVYWQSFIKLIDFSTLSENNRLNQIIPRERVTGLINSYFMSLQNLLGMPSRK